MIRVGIYGYGNLGRGVECAVRQADDVQLVAVFTRRDPKTVSIISKDVPVYSVEKAPSLRDAIDVMILCGGSATDLPVQTPQLALSQPERTLWSPKLRRVSSRGVSGAASQLISFPFRIIFTCISPLFLAAACQAGEKLPAAAGGHRPDEPPSGPEGVRWLDKKMRIYYYC